MKIRKKAPRDHCSSLVIGIYCLTKISTWAKRLFYSVFSLFIVPSPFLYIACTKVVSTGLKPVSKRIILHVWYRIYSLRKTKGKSVTNSGYAYVTQWFWFLTFEHQLQRKQTGWRWFDVLQSWPLRSKNEEKLSFFGKLFIETLYGFGRNFRT